jgi:hypothetical protein
MLRVLLLSGILAAAWLQETPPAAAPAQAAKAAALSKSLAAFEKLKALAGDWEGKSTKGWTEKISYQVIAGGSVLMEVSYGAHPNEWMATMVHMDGENLMLTHYCVAKNQPRLRATEISDDLSSITFTFLDATNLPSRDKGHMDKCVMRLSGADAFTSRWTWYQNGKEDWMEEIEHRRMEKASGEEKPSAAPSTSAEHAHP